jgi:hypothetical protein
VWEHEAPATGRARKVDAAATSGEREGDEPPCQAGALGVRCAAGGGREGGDEREREERSRHVGREPWESGAPPKEIEREEMREREIG